MIDKEVWLQELRKMRQARERLGGYLLLFPEIKPNVQLLDGVLERADAVLRRDGYAQVDHEIMVDELHNWVQNHARALALVETRPRAMH